jgi:hypothetical protein
MYVLTPVARDPGLLFPVSLDTVRNKNAPRIYPLQEQSKRTLTSEPGLHAFLYVIHSRVFPNYHLPNSGSVPVFTRWVFRAESPTGGR